jgi:hypothetical protein
MRGYNGYIATQATGNTIMQFLNAILANPVSADLLSYAIAGAILAAFYYYHNPL